MKKTLLMIVLVSGMSAMSAASSSKAVAPTSGLFPLVAGGSVSTLKPTIGATKPAIGTTIKIVGPEQPLRQYGGDDLEYMNRQYQSATGMTR